MMTTNYRIEEHNYERFKECVLKTLAEQLLKEDNKDALAALLEWITE